MQLIQPPTPMATLTIKMMEKRLRQRKRRMTRVCSLFCLQFSTVEPTAATTEFNAAVEDSLKDPSFDPAMVGVTSVLEKVRAFGALITSLIRRQLRIICQKIVSSPQRRAKFRNYACIKYGETTTELGGSVKIASLMPIRDMKIRWNSTQAMAEHGLILKEVSMQAQVSMISCLFEGHRYLGFQSSRVPASQSDCGQMDAHLAP